MLNILVPGKKLSGHRSGMLANTNEHYPGYPVVHYSIEYKHMHTSITT